MDWLERLTKTNRELQSMRPQLEENLITLREFATPEEQEEFSLSKWIANQTGETQ